MNRISANNPKPSQRRLDVRSSKTVRGFLTCALVVGLLTGVGTVLARAQPEATAPLIVLESSPSRLVLAFSGGEPRVRNILSGDMHYAEYTIPGFEISGETGAPGLPVFATMLQVPPGVAPRIRVLHDDAVLLAAPAPVAPIAQPVIAFEPIAPLPKASGSELVMDAVVYGSDALAPQDVVTVGSTFVWGAQRVAVLRFFPLQYNPATQLVRFHRRVLAEVIWERSGVVALPVGEAHAASEFERMTRKIIANPQGTAGLPAQTAGAQFNERVQWSGVWGRIGIDDDAIYGIDCTDLGDAGFDISDLRLDTLHMQKNGPDGVDVAIQILDANADNRCNGADEIRFWGQATHTRYADIAYYWLKQGDVPGKRMGVRAATDSGAPVATTTQTVHIEQDRLYRSYVPMHGEYERWYWDLLSTTYPSYPPARTFTFTIESVAAQGGVLSAVIAGYDGDHHTQFHVNGAPVGEFDWSGRSVQQFSASLPEGLLVSGENFIQVTEVNSRADIIYPDYFDVTYRLRLQATDNYLRIEQPAPGNWRYHCGGFSGAEVTVYDVSDPVNAQILTGATVITGPTVAVEFGDTSSHGRQYAVVERMGVRHPSQIKKSELANLHDAANGADYLLITTAPLRPAFTALLELRKSQGLRAILVDVQTIYDEFSGGATDPAAIRAFLQYAYTRWRRPAPTYVLLAGDGSFDPLGYCTGPGVCLDGVVTPPETNQIPPFLVASDPWIGETAADNRYVTFFAEGGLPAMALGRLPVATVAEARAVVAKIVGYERQPTAEAWRSRVTFVADNAYDTSGELDPAGNFWDFSDQVAEDPMLVAAGLRVERLYLNVCDPAAHPVCTLPNPPYPPLKDGPSLTGALIGAIDAGSAIVNYTGHAALASWAGVPQIFNTEDVTKLNNQDRLPIVLDMTCYTGYFHYPGAPSLAETLLRVPETGSVAGWAASGLGVAARHDVLDRSFFTAVVDKEITNIGLATVYAKAQFFATGSQRQEYLDTYHLFGDPAMRIVLSESTEPPPTLTPEPVAPSLFMPLLGRSAQP